MADTYTRVKSNLIRVLQDTDYDVVALTGDWGTGKTHLWHDVKEELFGTKNQSPQPIYVSLFGAKSINELKLRILQSAYKTDKPAVQAALKTGGWALETVLKKITGGSAEEAALIWLPNLATNRLIVIDDVERKHKSLDIDEILGLLDEYSENHKVRFLILINTDKLADPNLWHTLHEKVIDTQVVLNPSSTEAFDIASMHKPYPHILETKTAITALGINNIRVIERVSKTIQHIADSADIADIPPQRWIPGTVLYTAAHYRAVKNAPPLEYATSHNSLERILSRENTPPTQDEVEWDTILEKLGLSSADEYEQILQEYLITGLLDTGRLQTLFAQYRREASNEAASKQWDKFQNAYWWDPHQSEHELLNMARQLLPTVNLMNPITITLIVESIEELGDKTLAREFLDEWIKSAPLRPEFQQLEERVFTDYGHKPHPDVLAALNKMRDKQHPPLTLMETIDRIDKNSGWGARERIALSKSTTQEYEKTLRQLGGNDLRRFNSEHLQWLRQGAFDENFQIATDNYLAACKTIVNTEPSSRLSKMITRSFQGRGLADKLIGLKGGDQ